MKFVDEYRNSNYSKLLVQNINNISTEKINIMEVCGTHTVSMLKYGIKDILPKNVNIITGPGCPVCVTHKSYIDIAIELSCIKNIIIATFGDMLRVPGKTSSLLKRKSQGGDIRIIYSAMDALTLAQNNQFKTIVFLSIGFETSIPISAITILEAKNKNINNLLFLTSHKIVIPVLKKLLEDKDICINGFILPGHVSVIIGEEPFKIFCNNYKIPGVITGFEPTDILQSINVLLNLIRDKNPKIVNEYKRIVKQDGNKTALQYINKVFTLADSNWRGIGLIENSGYKLNDQFKDFDALKHFNIDIKNYEVNSECICGDILKGKITPLKCPEFKKNCTPENPIGPCMVSSEGTCATYYKYHKEE